MAYKKKGASKIIKNQREKNRAIIDSISSSKVPIGIFNKTHIDELNEEREEIKHSENHGEDTFGI